MTTTRTALDTADEAARRQAVAWTLRHSSSSHLACGATQASMIECDRMAALLENYSRSR